MFSSRADPQKSNWNAVDYSTEHQLAGFTVRGQLDRSRIPLFMGLVTSLRLAPKQESELPGRHMRSEPAPVEVRKVPQTVLDCHDVVGGELPIFGRLTLPPKRH